MDSLELLGFGRGQENLRPSIEHRTKVGEWPVPEKREELYASIWFTLFLRITYLGGSDMSTFKEFYMQQVEKDLSPLGMKKSVRSKSDEK